MKKTRFLIFFILFVIILSQCAFADDVSDKITSSIDKELEDFKNSLPDEVIEFLPDDVFKGDFSALLSDSLSVSSFWELIISYLFSGIDRVLKFFASILVLILISSIFTTLSTNFSSGAVKNTFHICSTLCISITVFNICISICEMVSSYLNTLTGVMGAFSPIMTAMYIMSGNISSATVGNASILLFISIVDGFLVVMMLPLVKVCMAFSFVNFIGGKHFGNLPKIIKTTFTSVTVFIMSIFMFVFSFKNVLSQGVDSLSIKTARFAISSFVPIVGASINDALRTVSTSISFIKSSCGIIAIIAIAVIMLPLIIFLFLNKLSFGILGSVSKMVGCEEQGSILEEASSICTFLLTLVCCTCVLFIFALTLFIKSSVEVGV